MDNIARGFGLPIPIKTLWSTSVSAAKDKQSTTVNRKPPTKKPKAKKTGVSKKKRPAKKPKAKKPRTRNLPWN
jgi:hypothetical protein